MLFRSGWVDLFTPYYSYSAPGRSYLWQNNGDGTVTDVAVTAGMYLANLPPGLNPEGACAGDFDDDGDLDLYVASLAKRQSHQDKADLAAVCRAVTSV